VRRPYYLIRRDEFWYYRLNRESGLVESNEVTWHTTGCKIKSDAERFMADLISSGVLYPDTPIRHQTFHQYAKPFFIWGECPHIRRVLEETGRFMQRHARIQRGRLEKYIFGDPIANKRLSEITRADIFDLRSRLLKHCSPATTNKAIDVVKVVLRESVIREELDRDPTELVRRVHHKKRERGIFTVEELKQLFPDHGYGPWKDAAQLHLFLSRSGQWSTKR